MGMLVILSRQSLLSSERDDIKLLKYRSSFILFQLFLRDFSVDSYFCTTSANSSLISHIKKSLIIYAWIKCKGSAM